MPARRMPEKVRGLRIERTGAELLVYNTNDDTSHHLTDIDAEVFEACNGVRSPHDVLAERVHDSVTIDLVDRVLIDLTEAQLITGPR